MEERDCTVRAAPTPPLKRHWRGKISAVCSRAGPSALQFANRSDRRRSEDRVRARECEGLRLVACEDVRVREVLARLHLEEEMFRGTDLQRDRAVAEQLPGPGKE